jgi:hypothetical protein
MPTSNKINIEVSVSIMAKNKLDMLKEILYMEGIHNDWWEENEVNLDYGYILVKALENLKENPIGVRMLKKMAKRGMKTSSIMERINLEVSESVMKELEAVQAKLSDRCHVEMHLDSTLKTLFKHLEYVMFKSAFE